MTNYFHISLWKPENNPTGGVAAFAAYLGRAVPEMEYLDFKDYPNWEQLQQSDEHSEYDWAYNLNAWALEVGILDRDSVVVCDGYWGYGLPGKVKRLISVVHGSYYGRFVQSQIASWGEIIGMDQVEAQFEVWNDSATEIVCVAEQSVHELEFAKVGHSIHVIRHGVDLDVLRPMPEIDKVCFMHGATSNRKGLDILSAMANIDPSIKVEFMDEPSGVPEMKARRLNEAICLVAPTRHEGNSYMLLEALACGVPLLTYPTGLATHEMDDRCGIITDDLAPQNMLQLLRTFDRTKYDPRDWAEEHASLEKFTSEWRSYLDVE